MKTTNKLFKEQVQAHILDILMNEADIESGYDIETTKNNLVQTQLQIVVNEFKNWYGPYKQKQIPNNQEAFMDWLTGLPSSINAEYRNYAISDLLREWFEECGVEYKEQTTEKEVRLYYHLVYREFRTLCKKHEVEVF